MIASLSGRIGVVSGAGSGIGKAVAISLARAGANVSCLDRDISAATETAVFINTRIEAAGLGGSSIAVQADIADAKSVEEALRITTNKLQGVLTHGVNCAGITSDAFMHKMSEEQWDRVVDVNMKGSFLFTKALSNQMTSLGLPDHGGSIVNIASIIGKVGNLGQANYSASKAGVIALSKTAAKELARKNIRVNVVLPGFIDTPMAQAVPEKVINKMLEQIPMGRLGKAEEISNVCVFLCSDLSSFVTGAQIEVTGGQFM